MGPAFYVIAILGCGEADALCEPVSTLPARYASREACEAATTSAIERNSDILYPVVVAECRQPGTEISQKVWADEVKLPAPNQEPRLRRASYSKIASRS